MQLLLQKQLILYQMKKLKMTLDSIQGKLSRNEMKNIIGGQNQPPATCSYSCASEPNSCNGGCSCHGTAPWRYCA